MHRIAALLAVAVLAGCAGRNAPDAGPEPVPVVLDAPSEPQSAARPEPGRRTRPTDTLDSPIEVEIAAELERAAEGV